MFKKITVLFLALLLPVAIFIFLKSFGKNEFEVKPMFQDEVNQPADCSSFNYQAPYQIKEDYLTGLFWKKSNLISVMVFADSITEGGKKIRAQVERLQTEFKHTAPRIILHDYAERFKVEHEGKGELSIALFYGQQFSSLKNCIFLLSQSTNAVLIDQERRIRGQYDLTDLDEADRLIMEMKIILKQY